MELTIANILLGLTVLLMIITVIAVVLLILSKEDDYIKTKIRTALSFSITITIISFVSYLLLK